MSNRNPFDPAELPLVLAGDEEALEHLVDWLTPVVQVRVARSLLRNDRHQHGQDIRSIVEDIVQEVFVTLFAADARVLRQWQPDKGLSLANFVGLVAERRVQAVLRSARRNPWTEEPTELMQLESQAPDPGPEEVTASREGLEVLLARLKEDLSPLGWKIFQLIFVLERSVPEVIRETSLSADAVYAWRSRLRRRARDLSLDLEVSSSHVG
ncbi:MAG: hypothetical protein K0U98_08330 [Deltaproteobacteria bacterium]|nr:hypothetical protein [Deltaproteobacteria bacterium]